MWMLGYNREFQDISFGHLNPCRPPSFGELH